MELAVAGPRKRGKLDAYRVGANSRGKEKQCVHAKAMGSPTAVQIIITICIGSRERKQTNRESVAVTVILQFLPFYRTRTGTETLHNG